MGSFSDQIYKESQEVFKQIGNIRRANRSTPKIGQEKARALASKAYTAILGRFQLYNQNYLIAEKSGRPLCSDVDIAMAQVEVQALEKTLKREIFGRVYPDDVL